jgi:hypothetical protein
MPKDESKSDPSDARNARSARSNLPVAWEPITPYGVAALSQCSLARLFLVQFIVALLVVGPAVWFLTTHWFPTIRQAIQALPATGQIDDGQLFISRPSPRPLAESRFLTLTIDAGRAAGPVPASDLLVEFHRRTVDFCSFLGCMTFEYPKGWTVQFNRPELESRWDAWHPILLGVTAFVPVVSLFLAWILLATVYAPFIHLYSYFKDRELSFAGSWKLSAAAMLPGALVMGIALVLYGLELIPLTRLCLLWVLHFVLGWIYLLASPLLLPRASDATSTKRDPFGPKKLRRSNPFVARTRTEKRKKRSKRSS